MKTRLDNRLSKLVKDGKITDAQKTAIENKLADERSKFNADSFKSLTPQQRKDAIQKEQADLKSWAQSQGIDPSYVMMFGITGRRGGYWHKHP